MNRLPACFAGILDAGEFDAGTGPVGVSGWDYAEGLAVGDTLPYPVSLDRETVVSAVLVWHRYIDDAFVSYLPDYEVSIYDHADTRVAFSDSVTSNTELIEAKPAAGDYRISIRVKSDGGSTDGLSYGLAWIGKQGSAGGAGECGGVRRVGDRMDGLLGRAAGPEVPRQRR